MPVYLTTTLVTLALALAPATDHLPKNLISPTEPERTLGVVTLDKTTARDLIHRYGKPEEIKNYADNNDAVRGERTYTWQLANCKLRIWTWFQPNKESAVTAVDIWGHEVSSDCVTGHGLHLGSPLSEVQKNYGRFQQGRKTTDHLLYAHVEWGNGTEADVDFDNKNKVTHIQLAISVE